LGQDATEILIVLQTLTLTKIQPRMPIYSEVWGRQLPQICSGW